MAGKGSKPRPVDPKTYAANFDAIRWPKRPAPPPSDLRPPISGPLPTDTCPKCGSPQVEEQTNYAKETGRTWWVCGTFQTRDCHPHYSELCCEREEKNILQRKVEDRVRTEAEAKRDQWRECAERLADAISSDTPKKMVGESE